MPSIAKTVVDTARMHLDRPAVRLDDPTGDVGVAAPLDLLLTQAALGPTRRFFPGMSTLRFAAGLAKRPGWVAGRAGSLAGELGRILAGTSDIAPSGRDRRFTDPAWTENPLLLGTEIDLAQITVDTYVVAGFADHLCPWEACYRSGQLLGGKTRFVSTSGHIAALVNPPTNTKSGYRVADDNSAVPAEWQRLATTERGSWWPDYAAWLAARSEGHVPPPAELGNARYRPLQGAPGSYVLDT